MIKMIFALTFRRDMRADEAMRYYEERHAPLICELFDGMLADYRRNYVVQPQDDGADSRGQAAGPTIDVITETWFEDEATFERVMARMNEPGIAERVAQDEAMFLDRASMRAFRVVERETDRNVSPLGAAARPRISKALVPDGGDC